MIAVLELLVVCWLPGAALLRAPVASTDRRAALPAEERAYWSVLLSLALSLALVLLLGAAHRYSFGRLLIADGMFTLLCLVAGWRRPWPPPRWPGLGALAAIALALVAAVRFAPPSEYVI